MPTLPQDLDYPKNRVGQSSVANLMKTRLDINQISGFGHRIRPEEIHHQGEKRIDITGGPESTAVTQSAPVLIVNIKLLHKVEKLEQVTLGQSPSSRVSKAQASLRLIPES